MNPIFRWTIGGCTRNGYDCLEMSIRTATKIYGDRFDYFVLYNNCNVQQLREIVGHRPITLVEQDWEHNPLGLEKGKNRGTSLWKFCPTRLDPSRHEIICDNDLVIVNRFPQMEEFLRSSDKVLMVEDPIKFQGKFRHLFGSVNYNAGFIGLPPGYDFAAEMLRTWRDNGSPSEVNQPDEQGLTTATLARMPSIVVGKDRSARLPPSTTLISTAAQSASTTCCSSATAPTLTTSSGRTRAIGTSIGIFSRSLSKG